MHAILYCVGFCLLEFIFTSVTIKFGFAIVKKVAILDYRA